MKIVHVIDSLAIGGAEMLLINFIRYYKQVEPSDSHIVVILKDEKGLLPQIINHLEDFSIISFDKDNIISGIRKFRKLVKYWKPNIIHTHLFYSTMLARFGTPKGISVISTYHNQSYCKSSPYFSPYFSILDRYTFGKNYFRVYVSEAVRDCIENSTKSKRNGFLIGNFVNTNFYPSWALKPSNASLKLVAIGSLKKVKNHFLLIEALSLLPNNKNVSIDIYGEGELREEMQQKIKKREINIHLKGNQTLSSEILKDYDAYIMPSLSEGQPVALLEAMSTGLPSLLSDIPSLKNLAGDAALYFSPTSAQDLATKIKLVLENKDFQLKSMSEVAIKLAKPYSIENYFNKINDLYSTALNVKNRN